MPRTVSSDEESSTASKALGERDYRDYYHVAASDVKQEIHCPEGKRRGPRGGVVVPFPVKLYTMLKGVEQEGMEHVVSWLPHGRCFMVHKPKEFVEDIMPRYFRQTKLTSFQRQLNLYGFLRLNASRERGGYYHELFLRGREDLPKIMLRTRVKRNGLKGGGASVLEHDFYAMPLCSSGDNTPSLAAPAKAAALTLGAAAPAPAMSEHQPLSLDAEPLVYDNDVEEARSIFVPETTYLDPKPEMQMRPVVSLANLRGVQAPLSMSDATKPKPLSLPPSLATLALPQSLNTHEPHRFISEDASNTGFFEGQRFRCMDPQSLQAFERALIRPMPERHE